MLLLTIPNRVQQPTLNMKQKELSFFNGKVNYVCVMYMLHLFPTLWKELVQFGTIPNHRCCGWEID